MVRKCSCITTTGAMRSCLHLRALQTVSIGWLTITPIKRSRYAKTNILTGQNYNRLRDRTISPSIGMWSATKTVRCLFSGSDPQNVSMFQSQTLRILHNSRSGPRTAPAPRGGSSSGGLPRGSALTSARPSTPATSRTASTGSPRRWARARSSPSRAARGPTSRTSRSGGTPARTTSSGPSRTTSRAT